MFGKNHYQGMILTIGVQIKMPSHFSMNGQHEEDNPCEVSPMGFDGRPTSLHGSRLSCHRDSMLPPSQHCREHEQNPYQQFAPNWPLPPIGLSGLIDSRTPVPMLPTHTPLVTPGNSLEDVSLDEPSQKDSMQQEDEQPQHIILHEKSRGRLPARSPHLASLALNPSVVLRPSSFEIMGCFTPIHIEYSAGYSNECGNGNSSNPVLLQHHGPQYGLNRTRTPYPERAGPALVLSEGIRRIQVIQNSEVTGGRVANASQNGVLRNSYHNRQSSPERYGTKRLVALITAAAFTLASFLFLAQAVAVITVFRASGRPVSHGYIVECILSVIFFCPSITGLVFVLAGGSIDFRYTLRSPFARCKPTEPKELELGSTSRTVSAINQDIERGDKVQHRVTVQPAVPMPLRRPAESRERLLRAAAPSATVAPSNTQTSIMTELCNAVSAHDGRP